MPVDDRMTVDERRKYLGRMKQRYDRANRRERGQLLDEMEKVTDMHRKHIIRLLNAPDLSRKPRRRQQGRKYGSDVVDAIRVLAESLDYICAERNERGSLLITTNLEFARWVEVFGDAILTGALLDRLTHHAQILLFQGKSYRFRESRQKVENTGQPVDQSV